MSLYAQCLIEDPRTGTKYIPGDVVPEGIPGLDDLIAGGAVGDAKPERNVRVNSDNRVIREIDEAGIVNRTQHIKRFDGDFTPEEIKDPLVETPLAGVHVNADEHRQQDPSAYETSQGFD